MLLCRTVRFALSPVHPVELTSPRSNAYAAWPTAEGWHAHVSLEIAIAGEPDPRTGYLISIQEIDDIARRTALPLLDRSFREGGHQALVLKPVAEALKKELPFPLRFLILHQSRFLSFQYEDSMPNHATLTQSFEFAASHRLHCDDLDAAANQRIFGKCNNAAGHGHNYRLEVSVRSPIQDPPTFSLTQLEKAVREHAIDKLDHKHLNTDVASFAKTNPSVESIARVCHQWIVDPVKKLGGELVRVRVWETEKTSAIYPG
ncbi:MAG: 6-carboxytetrahydropterin synthase [Planctomycetes bacterium]|nr:6-carboxytetrahydropterin synthase [Planctomycetota bacterium]